MHEFMLEHLQITYGIKEIAWRKLARIYPTLENLYKESHPYGLLLCRLLNLFD